MAVNPNVERDERGRFFPIEIDPLLKAFFGMDEIPDNAEEVPDAIGKLFESAALSAGMAAPGFADALASESAKYARKRESDAPLEVEETRRLEKRFGRSIHSGKRAHRVEKSANGHWVLEYDENDNILRGYSIEEFQDEVNQ